MDGYCGLYCGACPVMVKTKNGEGDNPCFGCKSEHPAGHCADCAIKKCASAKGYDFCNECRSLSQCELIKQFASDPKWPYHAGIFKNLETLHKDGVGEWLLAQQKRWICRTCGTNQTWWDETCSHCGGHVDNYKADLQK
jgi:hypothetical protein